MSVYQGKDSCYARREGVYVRRVRRKGIDTVWEAVGILYLILRDLRRGFTYRQGDCRVIRMSGRLFARRVSYVPVLAKRHGAGEKELERIRRLARFVLSKKRLPRRVWGRPVKRIVEEMVVELSK